MNKLLTIVALFFIFLKPSSAATYYFSTGGGNDSRTSTQAQSSSTPWQTITKLNAVLSSLVSGDSILFKAGETFTGSISSALKSGINYDRYGTGNDPIINGYSTLNGSFTVYSGNIWQASLTETKVQIVNIDGGLHSKGRYPNTGYIVYTSHTTSSRVVGGNTIIETNGIIGAGVSSIPFDPAGATAIVRKARYYLDGQRITSRSGTTLNLSINSNDLNWGYCAIEVPTAMDGNGFFIQDHISTLDQDGEWYYDETAHIFYLYSSTNPNSRAVKVGGIQTGFNNSSGGVINISHLKITGFNNSGIILTDGLGGKITNCTIDEIGGNGIEGDSGAGPDTITSNIITNCLNSAMIFGSRDDMLIAGNTIDSTAMFLGMSKSGDAAANAIHFGGSFIQVKHNTITNSGFNGISSYAGSDWSVDSNLIVNYCMVKDDGGAVYQYGINTTPKSNRFIVGNIAINGPGNWDGLGAYAGYQEYGQAYAFYLDNFSDHVSVLNNFSAEASGGSFHNSTNCNFNTISNNTFYNGGALGLLFLDADGTSIHDLTVTNNTIISIPGEPPIYVYSNASSNIDHFGTFNNNVFSTPLDPLNTRIAQWVTPSSVITTYTLAQWQSTFSKDLSSTLSTVRTGDINNIRYDYNGTNSPTTTTLPYAYQSVTEVLNATGSLVLQPYTGSVLIYYGPLGPGKIYVNPSGKVLTNSSNKIFTSP